MIPDQGEVAYILSANRDGSEVHIEAHCTLKNESPTTVLLAYVSSSRLDPFFYETHTEYAENTRKTPKPTKIPLIFDSSSVRAKPVLRPENVKIFAAKKYKPVALRTKPIIGELPSQFRIHRDIQGDPLANMPKLNPHPKPFTPTGRYTQERKEIIDKIHDSDFLWPAERDLLHDFMMQQNEAFAWDDSERGHFREDFFPPVEMPVVPHTPWVLRNIPIPPGKYNEICKIIRQKIDAGVYEPSNSSYRSRWFCVEKKNGSLRLVHSLEPLNAVTIQHSGVPPHTDQLAENFAGRPCGGILDLYVGYDERGLAKISRDLTTFQTPFGALRLVTLPMGWTNSVPIFHDDVTYILQPEIPHVTIPYIDDVPIRGPDSEYRNENGDFVTIPENPGIRRFVWEHFNNVNRVCQRMKYCGGTFSGPKAVIIAEEITVVGHRCTPKGRLPNEADLAKIVKWGPCETLKDVRSFLGTVGVARIFIKNYAAKAQPLTKLTKKDAPFEFGPEQIAAQETLKNDLVNSQALRPINYESEAPVILAVDTSYIAVGFALCQLDELHKKIRYFARFGSITLNEREARFSQAKLEIYGLYRALRAYKLFLIGVRNLIVEVDALYIKGMLHNPDISPSAAINRWILAILTFHFSLVHVPGLLHLVDGLSRRTKQPGDIPSDDEGEDEDEFEDWIDQVYGFLHILNPVVPPPLTPSSPHFALLTSVKASEPSREVCEIFFQPAENGDPPLEQLPGPISYTDFPRSEISLKMDKRLALVREWHETLRRPSNMHDNDYAPFIRYAQHFVLRDAKLWRKNNHGNHQLVLEPHRRLQVLQQAHDEIGHRGVYSTHAHLAERFWWPAIQEDVKWYVETCHLCQVRQSRNLLIPPTVQPPASLFAKMYMDTMHMPPSNGFKCIVQGRCSLSHFPEWRMLRTESAKNIAEWIFQDVLCRWGTLVEIVSDNGGPFVKANAILRDKYHINHIRISGYNSRANGLVEKPHFDVRQALYKAADGDQSRWSQVAYSVFWADRITIRKRLGVSPYFVATGTHPLLPLDIVEATYLLPPPTSLMSTEDLIASRSIALQKRQSDLDVIRSKVHSVRNKAARRFELEHMHTIINYDFARGDLVLMRNTAIEKSLNRKMRARYLGPLVVVSRNRGGAYILAELNGVVFDRPIAQFRVIPYKARKSIPLPDLSSLDVSSARIRELELSETAELDLADSPVIPEEDDEDREAAE